MSQALTRRNFTPGSLRGHEDARTVLLRMALDHGRAQRIHEQKQRHPELTWREIADKVGVSERSAHSWQQTGGISHPNCKKLAAVFNVDPDWLWSGADVGRTDLLETLSRAGPSQLDRIEAMLVELLSQVAALELGASLDAEGSQHDEPKLPRVEAPGHKNRSRRAS